MIALPLVLAILQAADLHVIAYCRTSRVQDIRRVFDSSKHEPRLSASEDALDDRSKVVASLESKGFKIVQIDKLVVAIDQEIDFFVKAKRMSLLFEALKKSKRDGIFEVRPGGDPISEQVIQEVAGLLRSDPPKGEFAIRFAPTFFVGTLSDKASGGSTLFVDMPSSAGEALRSNPFVPTTPMQKDKSNQQEIAAEGPGFSVAWSPSTNLPGEIPIANETFQKELESAVNQENKARDSFADWVGSNYPEETGGNSLNGAKKVSDLSPWLRNQLLNNVRGNYKQLGFQSPDDAVNSYSRSDRIAVDVRLSYSFYYRDQSGSWVRMTMATH